MSILFLYQCCESEGGVWQVASIHFNLKTLFLDEIKNQVQPDYYEFGCLVQNTNAVLYP